MKKYLISAMLAATGFAAQAQTSFLQDGKGESAYKLLGNAISVNNLILLGLSSATYAALKTTENKSAANEAARANPPETNDPQV